EGSPTTKGGSIRTRFLAMRATENDQGRPDLPRQIEQDYRGGWARQSVRHDAVRIVHALVHPEEGRLLRVPVGWRRSVPDVSDFSSPSFCLPGPTTYTRRRILLEVAHGPRIVHAHGQLYRQSRQPG